MGIVMLLGRVVLDWKIGLGLMTCLSSLKGKRGDRPMEESCAIGD